MKFFAGAIRGFAGIAITIMLTGCLGGESTDPTGNGFPLMTASANPTPIPSPSSSPTPSPVVQRGNRTLGIDIVSLDQSNSFSANVSRSQSVGAGAMTLQIDWASDEPTTASDCTTAGSYTDSGHNLSNINSALPGTGMKLSLTFPVTNTNILEVPSNLASKAFDGVSADTNLLTCRFEKFLSWVATQIPNVELVSVQIGNELSAYPTGADPTTAVAFWGSYWQFLAQTIPYAKTLWPNAPVSVTDSAYGILGTGGNAYSKGGMQQLIALADFVSITYYPISSGFTMKPPTVVSSELGAVLSLYPNLPLRIQEIGYASDSKYDNSSEAQQAEFVTQVFQFWDQNASRVPFISFLRMVDYSYATAVTSAGTYGSSDAAFIAYLETLGLWTYAGTPKASFAQLQTETSERGW